MLSDERRTKVRCKYMKNYSELTQNFYDFVKKHSGEDVPQLCMRSARKTDEYNFPLHDALCQIECRQKTTRKLSRWLKEEKFLFPCLEVAEQSTHQCVAAYHAAIAGNGKDILDITAGLGIDAFTLAEAGNRVYAVELDPNRAGAIAHNAEILRLPVNVTEGDSLALLRNMDPNQIYDIIFADPARRDSNNRRLYSLADCFPDVVGNFYMLASHARQIIIKASPLVDISNVCRQLPDVTEIHIVCVKGECKETLIVCTPGIESVQTRDSRQNSTLDTKNGRRPETGDNNGLEDIAEVPVTVADLEETSDGALKFRSKMKLSFKDRIGECKSVTPNEIVAGNYLYDPNAGIHKLNCGSALCRRFTGLIKLSPNTDLYICKELHKDFPGRIFCIESIADKKAVKSMKGSEAEVVVRNYPLKAEELRKKLRLKSGDTKFVVGCRAGKQQTPLLLICKKL